MFKYTFFLLLVFIPAIISGQNITLLKNYNPKVKELKHSLNTTNDSLVLACDKTIFKVDIFNEDYERIIVVEEKNARIPLNDIPVGSFVIEAKLEDKIVVMNITKHNEFPEVAKKETVSTNSISFLLSKGNRNRSTNKKQKFYWTLTEVNNGNCTSKTMKLVNQESADRMILKNKVEQNSAVGKLNELTVWEIYDTSKFMKEQVSDANYIYSQSSNVFNTTPYYTTKNSIQNL